METYDLDSWDEFRPKIREITAKIREITATYGPPQVLFRGHGCSGWSLATTLERATKDNISIEHYLVEYALRCRNELESLTGKTWNIPEVPNLREAICQNSNPMKIHLPCYPYLIYLRHHGFPSPLLDWTASPYVAAYFAFCENNPCNSCDNHPRDPSVAIYAFVERPKGHKGQTHTHGADVPPQITLMGPYATTHIRHFAQRAQYTVATKYNYAKEEHAFCRHEQIFEREDKDQDLLIKVTVPSRDRIKALEELREYNINHFTLFQTEDALIKTLALRYFDLAGS